MKPQIDLMHKVWDGLIREERLATDLPKLRFDEIVSSIFAIGPFYYYLIDFFDMSISNMSPGFEEAHGIRPENVRTINDILGLIHPDDMDFVSRAEKKSVEFVLSKIGVQKTTKFKASYNFRFKTADGSYHLFNHQALVLTMDENNNFIRSLNIHTDISHLTNTNNHRLSFLGLAGEPTFLDIEVYDQPVGRPSHPTPPKMFTRREIEIIKLLAEGLDTRSIAGKLFLSPSTVETHRKNILRKSECDNSVQLVARSMSEGWI